MAGKNTPKTVLREYRENFHAQKHSSRQSIYTKATRIFLQHPILILYTALFVEKGQCGSSSVSPQRILSHAELGNVLLLLLCQRRILS